LKILDRPILFTIVAFVIVCGYTAMYFTEAHARASQILRAEPHSYRTLIIYRGRWSEDFTDVRYLAIRGNGWESVRVRFDGKSESPTVD